MKGLAFLCCAFCAALSLSAVNWEGASISGTTPGGRMCFGLGEEIVLTLQLDGVDEPLPAETYFVDWERRGDDGKRERGRVALPFPAGGHVIRTSSDTPGWVLVEANVVDKAGKRVPKNHPWEKRVFFQGGALVAPGEIPMAEEPRDFDAFWSGCLKELSKVPLAADVKPVESSDVAVKLYAVSIACAGPRPVTGWLSVPVDASASNRLPIEACFRGASHDDLAIPKELPHDRIYMIVSANGFELGKGAEYVKQFFASICKPGFEYGFDPDSNRSRETSYWKYCALRAVRYVQWLKTLPEWDGKNLTLSGGSQGDWQAYWAAAFVPGVTKMNANGSWGCDWKGQSTLGRIKSTYRPGCWFDDMAYFDPVFLAKRITCPVDILFAGLGDTCSTPDSLTLVYRNLRGPKSITYVQGSTHGWRPDAVQRKTYRAKATEDPLDSVRRRLAKGVRSIEFKKDLYTLAPKGKDAYLKLDGVSNVTIDFGGSELRGLKHLGFFRLINCTNVTIRNVTLDYAELPFTQAKILSRSADGTLEVKVLEGYPIPPEGGAPWPFQVYDAKSLDWKNPMRCWDGFKIEKTGADTFRISGGKNRIGDVGDYAVWPMPSPSGKVEGDHVSERDTIYSVNCAGCRFENITVYSTPGGRGFEEHLAGGNVYRACRLMRRAPEDDFAQRAVRRLRSGNHDAFMSRRAIVGPKILDCVAEYHCDDAVNISGMYGIVYAVKGNRIRLVEYIPSVFHVGDVAQSMAYDGKPLPDMKVVRVSPRAPTTASERAALKRFKIPKGIADGCKTAFDLTVDDASALKPGDAVISAQAQGSGFEVRRCRFGHNRALGLRIRGSQGVIENNTIERTECHAIKIAPEYEWMEGGSSRDIVVRGNIIRNCGGGILAGENNILGKPLPCGALRNIAVEGNVIAGGASPVAAIGCDNISIAGNVIESALHETASAIELKNVREAEPSPRLDWNAPESATIEDDVLSISLSEKGTAMASADFDFSRFAGKMVKVSVLSRGKGVRRSNVSYFGFKVMLYFVDETANQTQYLTGPEREGDWEWRPIEMTFNLRNMKPGKGKVYLGLQETTGTVDFNLASLRLEEAPPLFPVDRSTTKCRYSQRVLERPMKRGVMLPSTACKEDDFKTLHDWGVTLARYQMVRGWGNPEANRDVADYRRWIASKIDHLVNDVLPWAERYGIDIVVDVHVPPGGSRMDREKAMFHDPQLAEVFIDIWRTIARRCKGHPRIWGYDLFNEPTQEKEGAPGCDYWTLQERAARAIRAIDPVTPIIFESLCSDGPEAYEWMKASDLPDIIYQVHMYYPHAYTHQGVAQIDPDKFTPITYPNAGRGWDKEYLRERLAPVLDFQKRHGAVIYVGEFSAIAWAPNAGEFLADCISIFEEYGWSWTYHAFREWHAWDVEREADGPLRTKPSSDNARKRVLLRGFAGEAAL